jgi:hypothetical protein
VIAITRGPLRTHLHSCYLTVLVHFLQMFRPLSCGPTSVARPTLAFSFTAFRQLPVSSRHCVLTTTYELGHGARKSFPHINKPSLQLAIVESHVQQHELNSSTDVCVICFFPLSSPLLHCVYQARCCRPPFPHCPCSHFSPFVFLLLRPLFIPFSLPTSGLCFSSEQSFLSSFLQPYYL